MFNNKKQLLCLNNLSLEITKKQLWIVALYRSEKWTLGKNEEMVVNTCETWCWRRMLKIKWIGRIMNSEVFQTGGRRKTNFKILKNRYRP
jgi:hypothetical protein